VVAKIDIDDNGPSVRALLSTGRYLLRRLISRLMPTGVYAIGILRKGSDASIWCGFSAKADADRLADAVRAKCVSQWPGWASQRAFTLDESLRAVIAAALATRRAVDERQPVRRTEQEVIAKRRRRRPA
jgi:hypothetical protein